MAAFSSGTKPVHCPICEKEAVEPYRPFCSKRCADIDLARWFTGSYAVAGREEDEGDNATPADPHQHPEDDGDEG
jgi:hypothetical protein